MDVRETLSKRMTVAQLQDEWKKWDEEMERTMSSDDDFENAKAKRIGALAQIESEKAWHVEEMYDVLNECNEVILEWLERGVSIPKTYRGSMMISRLGKLVATMKKEE